MFGEEIDKIKDQLKKGQSERASFAKGGGMLRNQISIADGNENIATVKRVNISRIGKEISTEKNLGKSASVDEISATKAATLVEQKSGNLIDRFTTNAAALALRFVPGSADDKATAASIAGDRAAQASRFIANPFYGAYSLGKDLYNDGLGGKTGKAIAAGQTRDAAGTDAVKNSFAFDAGKGVDATVSTNAGLIASLQSERTKLSPKIRDLEDKERITEAEQIQIREAERNVTLKKELVSRLGNRKDFKAEGVRLDLDKAQSRLSTVKSGATLSDKEADEFSTVQSKDYQLATRIEELRRQDAEKLQKATEKTNEILAQIAKGVEAGNQNPPNPNAVRANIEQAKQ